MHAVCLRRLAHLPDTSISATSAALMVCACRAARAGESSCRLLPVLNTPFSSWVSILSRLRLGRSMLVGLETLRSIHGGASSMALAGAASAVPMADITRCSQPADAGANSLGPTENCPRLPPLLVSGIGSRECCSSCTSAFAQQQPVMARFSQPYTQVGPT